MTTTFPFIFVSTSLIFPRFRKLVAISSMQMTVLSRAHMPGCFSMAPPIGWS